MNMQRSVKQKRKCTTKNRGLNKNKSMKLFRKKRSSPSVIKKKLHKLGGGYTFNCNYKNKESYVYGQLHIDESRTTITFNSSETEKKSNMKTKTNIIIKKKDLYDFTIKEKKNHTIDAKNQINNAALTLKIIDSTTQQPKELLFIMIGGIARGISGRYYSFNAIQLLQLQDALKPMTNKFYKPYIEYCVIPLLFILLTHLKEDLPFIQENESLIHVLNHNTKNIVNITDVNGLINKINIKSNAPQSATNSLDYKLRQYMLLLQNPDIVIPENSNLFSKTKTIIDEVLNHMSLKHMSQSKDQRSIIERVSTLENYVENIKNTLQAQNISLAEVKYFRNTPEYVRNTASATGLRARSLAMPGRSDSFQSIPTTNANTRRHSQ